MECATLGVADDETTVGTIDGKNVNDKEESDGAADTVVVGNTEGVADACVSLGESDGSSEDTMEE